MAKIISHNAVLYFEINCGNIMANKGGHENEFCRQYNSAST